MHNQPEDLLKGISLSIYSLHQTNLFKKKKNLSNVQRELKKN